MSNIQTASAGCHIRRVVITGMGVVSPVGNDLETTWKNLVDGVCGIAPITTFDTSDLPVKIAAELKDFDPLAAGLDRAFVKRNDRFDIYYYDADFATRIKRFGTQASSSRDYYDDYYTYGSGGGDTYVYVNSYDPFYWDYYPSYYWGWSYRPYWSSYWSWNWYWGYPYHYSYYWGWDPYWSYGWGYHSHWHHHDWHHHHGWHHDWNGHGGGHHPGGNGGGLSSYVASVRHGNGTAGSTQN